MHIECQFPLCDHNSLEGIRIRTNDSIVDFLVSCALGIVKVRKVGSHVRVSPLFSQGSIKVMEDTFNRTCELNFFSDS